MRGKRVLISDTGWGVIAAIAIIIAICWIIKQIGKLR